MTPPVLAPISGRRRRRDLTARGGLAAATLLALIPLGVILYYLLSKGLGVISGHFLTSDPNGNFLGDPGGIQSAVLGTVEMVALATLLAVPLGLSVALYLTEYGRSSRFSAAVRYLIDVMTGVPSIVFGLFIYTTLVLTHIWGSNTAWKGSVALGLLMIPIVTRSAEVVLLLVPDSLREAALALGAPRWRVVTRVVLPTAAPGLLTGSLLAVARAAGETAPLLFTAQLVHDTSFDLGQRMNSLPVQIFSDILSASPRYQDRAWGAALTLVTLVLVLTLAARLLSRRSRLA
ncbi:MAG TPA: phosphate ABC transporter permease PstA [Solirubrobacteraceae bacterium]|jgi:phosphate transport system permease protein|nr:phosphate ABC transporter permease PstA [Solirubrobacteraceae bacterium]